MLYRPQNYEKYLVLGTKSRSEEVFFMKKVIFLLFLFGI